MAKDSDRIIKKVEHTPEAAAKAWAGLHDGSGGFGDLQLLLIDIDKRLKALEKKGD